MLVMMTNTSTIEEKMAEMEQRVILLTKALEEKEVKIATLMNKLEVQDSGESSLGPEHPPGLTLKGENARLVKEKEVKALLKMDIPPHWPRYLSNNCKT